MTGAVGATRLVFVRWPADPFLIFLTVFWLLGAVAVAREWRKPSFLLLGLMSLGQIISAPLLSYDGATRVFAATFALIPLQASIGLG